MIEGQGSCCHSPQIFRLSIGIQIYCEEGLISNMLWFYNLTYFPLAVMKGACHGMREEGKEENGSDRSSCQKQCERRRSPFPLPPSSPAPTANLHYSRRFYTQMSPRTGFHKPELMQPLWMVHTLGLESALPFKRPASIHLHIHRKQNRWHQGRAGSWHFAIIQALSL